MWDHQRSNDSAFCHSNDNSISYTRIFSSLKSPKRRFCISLCSLSHVELFATPWPAACQVPLSVGILQAKILEWVAMPSSRGSSDPGIKPTVSCIADRLFTISATQKAPVYLLLRLKNPFILFTLFLNLGLSVFPSNSLIFCRILPFSSDMCSTSPSLRNFFNTLCCFLANFLEKMKLYTCFFHSYNIIKATFSDNKWSDDHILSVASLWCFIF